MPQPLYFAHNLTLGDPTASVGLCLLWTPQERVLPALMPQTYAIAGNLYSCEGISYLLRNVLAWPTIRTIVLCGKDLTKSGAALLALMHEGVDANHCILGAGTQLHKAISLAAIELFRQNVQVIDARDTLKPQAIAALLADLPHNSEPFLPEPLLFPYEEPVAESFSAESSGFLLRETTIQRAYLKLIWQIMTFGQNNQTQHGPDQRELLDLMTVVTNESGKEIEFSPAPWLPFSRAALREYITQLTQAGQASSGVSYTYGDRLRAYAGKFDQIAAIVQDLRQNAVSRRAVATLWQPQEDSSAPNPPCLCLVQTRLRDKQLFLTAYFRSHDIYRAWAMNAYGLRALQILISNELEVLANDLIIVSHSAHIYAYDWEAAQKLIEAHYRQSNPRATHDPRGSFVISVEDTALAVQHFSPEGKHLQTFRAQTARKLSALLTPFISDIAHAIYLGQELQKAEIAFRKNLNYQQDKEFLL